MGSRDIPDLKYYDVIKEPIKEADKDVLEFLDFEQFKN